jgi:hypothetical protein
MEMGIATWFEAAMETILQATSFELFNWTFRKTRVIGTNFRRRIGEKQSRGSSTDETTSKNDVFAAPLYNGYNSII